MSAPAPFPRTPASGASTDPRWDVAQGGLPMVGAPAVAWPSPTATGFIGTGGTITPPSPAEPSPEPHPADHRLLAAERAFLTAARLELNAAEWRQYGLDQIRKARAGK